MSNLSQFFQGIGGGLSPKFQDFTASGNFTPTQGLIDAGGYIEVFLVGGGACGVIANSVGGSGGEVLVKKMYVSNTNPVTVDIGDGGPSNAGGSPGTGSIFSGSQAGGIDLFASGGLISGRQELSMGSGWGANFSQGTTAGNGIGGFGAGGPANSSFFGGVYLAKENSGQGTINTDGGSGFCSVTWFE